MQSILRFLNASMIYSFMIIAFATLFLFIPTGNLERFLHDKYSTQMLACAGIVMNIIVLGGLYTFRKTLLNLLNQTNQRLKKVRGV